MSEPRCEYSDLLVSHCAHCLGHKLGDEEEEVPLYFGGLVKDKK
jgi:hypothetical protein